MKFLKLLNVLNPLIYSYKYRVRHQVTIDPYKEAFKISKDLPVGSKEKKILIVPYRVAPGSNLFEGNCSIFFRGRGYTVDTLLCGQAVSHCEQIDSTSSKYLRCNLCFHEQKKFLTAFGLNGVFINNLVSKKELNQIEKEIETIDFNNLNKYLYKGILIYKPLMSALQRHYKKATYCIQKDREAIQGFLKTILITINALENYFKKNKVELVFFSHGTYSTWGAVQEYCINRGIKFVTWGREYHGAGVVAAHNSSYLNYPLNEPDGDWASSPLTAKQRSQIISYLEAKIGRATDTQDYIDYYKNLKKILPNEQILKSLSISEDRKIIALLPNIPWDGQAFRPNICFENFNAWLYETIDWFRDKEDCTLIIRTHPAEKTNNGIGLADVLKDKYSSLPDNIIVIPADSHITSLSIASISCGVLLYGSTIGYETTYLRIPTILASEFYYTNKNITFDAKNKAEYFEYVSKALKGELHVDDVRFERLLQYAYHHQFRRIMPETLMNLRGLSFSGYKYKEQDALLKDKVMNKFIDYCLSGEKFNFAEYYD
ncbi:Capsule polysaccharide biosynthesis protein (plasmid) [Legionella adelaidensis]|uniref:Capsule polysaccharide biosynthesis protein n=1 Tax=Legionella adelaidensis TaxID=45056 RepID=A0A0W0R4U4_9GAMM|nr:hypothetical protein [Legionella adelaidensis]KTC66080.1 Capsule polysaccharide biosynthesis protein [Legionella adelaidensis]VEH85702.1 Capsule polysaccharide biosynthesis protein [Legionella adelaidensis]